jgi:hypothetical protein
MINIEQFQQHRKQQVDAVLASAGTVSKGVQEIVAAYADYSKKSFEESRSYVAKLAGVKSLDKAVEVQTEYAKGPYELFTAEMGKIGELYKTLVKETCEPLAGLISKPPSPAN